MWIPVMICVDFSFSDTHWKSLLNHSQIQWPGDDVWRHRPGSTFFHVMACTLLGAKPLPQIVQTSYGTIFSENQDVLLIIPFGTIFTENQDLLLTVPFGTIFSENQDLLLIIPFGTIFSENQSKYRHLHSRKYIQNGSLPTVVHFVPTSVC